MNDIINWRKWIQLKWCKLKLWVRIFSTSIVEITLIHVWSQSSWMILLCMTINSNLQWYLGAYHPYELIRQFSIILTYDNYNKQIKFHRAILECISIWNYSRGRAFWFRIQWVIEFNSNHILLETNFIFYIYNCVSRGGY